MVPFCAVTTVVITLLPTDKAIAEDGLPLATVTPFTLTEAKTSDKVGVTVMDDVAFGTETV